MFLQLLHLREQLQELINRIFCEVKKYGKWQTKNVCVPENASAFPKFYQILRDLKRYLISEIPSDNFIVLV